MDYVDNINEEEFNQLVWILFGSIHDSKRVTMAHILDYMDEKKISCQQLQDELKMANDYIKTLMEEKYQMICRELLNNVVDFNK